MNCRKASMNGRQLLGHEYNEGTWGIIVVYGYWFMVHELTHWFADFH